MSDKATLLALAEKVEGLDGPDRELGREVLRACGWKQSGHGYFLGPLTGWTSPDGKTWFDDDAFARHDPTASIDAALTLVPEGWQFQIHPCQALVIGEGIHRSIAATPALALCAAALRARAETQP